MSENSKIQWTTHTFNPWWGCTRVSPGCEHCYAETFAGRFGVKWGVRAERRFFGEKHWREPFKWNDAAAKAGRRDRVFCASMADVFEDRRDLDEPRARLHALIRDTPHLDWLLLTKRPENAERLWTEAHIAAFDGSESLGPTWAPNVWLGTTVEDQKRADERIPHLLRVPAAVRFLSCEPLLGPVDLHHLRCPGGGTRSAFYEWSDDGPDLHWIIVGGESGPGARPFKVKWARSIVKQCRAAGVPVFVKQMGAFVVDRNDAGFEAENEVWAEGPQAGQPVDPKAWPTPLDIEHDIDGWREEYQGAPCRVRLRDHKGGDWNEWPSDLRVREFPKVRA